MQSHRNQAETYARGVAAATRAPVSDVVYVFARAGVERQAALAP